ncbi:S8 family peptidase [Saccharothrix lopnurensis]|uniref:S8 family peptidase n=1 Tax=Saccharothrix lopnurensis TaxID=1670621 RepID=A0ABW1PFB4_9PSEU
MHVTSRFLGVVAAAGVTAALVTAPPATAQVSPKLLAHPPGATVVTDRYIVVLDDTTARTAVPDLAARYAGKVNRIYDSALRGFSVELDARQAARLARDPAVRHVEPVVVGRASDTQQNPPSWGLDRVDQRSLPLSNSYTYNTTASNVTAYVVDSGIRMTHQSFGGRAKSGYDFVDDDTDASDCLGHGTHVAGTIGGSAYGVAKGVKLVSVRVLDCNDSATTEDTLAGIDWVTRNAVKPAVANFSLYFGSSAPSVENAIKSSISSGVVWTLSGNNQGTDACRTSPAKLPEAITVGNTTTTDARSSTSNYGSCLDIWAPGTNIVSASHQNDTGTRTMTGTSMAAPHVAGAAALHLAGNPSASAQQVRDALVGQASAVTIGDAGPGSPNRLLNTLGGGTTPPPVCGPFTNPADVAIPDAGAAVTSPLSVTNCRGNAPATTKVDVDIRHTWRGDLVVDLVAPDGTVYPLKPRNDNDSADNVIATYTVDASAEPANGTWQLRARDVVRNDTGTINSWSLTF